MDDRDALLHGDVVAQPPGDLVDGGELAGLRLLPLRRPSLDLAFDVTLALGEIAETDLVDVGGVQVGEHIDQVLGEAWTQRHRQLGGALGPIEHDPVDEAHHVERRADDIDVGAQAEHRRHRNVGAPDGRDDAVFAGHVVSGRQHVAERRATQDESSAGGVGDRVGEVRATAGDQREIERRRGTLDVRLEPGTDSIGVDALHGRHRIGG